ncbi:MAG: DUF4143 domain-containing protein [Gammaproteobacteria bacterium]|nr:DUF4143 domain-containing protein [Gammaproteobacteria bacterium]
MFQRYVQNLLYELMGEFRIVYLTGPRQSGKTTLAKIVAEMLSIRYVSLDDQAMRAAVEFDPHGFVRSLGDECLVIDEFQYVPGLVPAIKEASDQLATNQRGKFLLTGSADLFASTRVQEAMPGHLARLELLPLSVAEIVGNRRNALDSLLQKRDPYQSEYPELTRIQIADAIVCGGFPEMIGKSRQIRKVWFDSYIRGRLLKDFESLYATRKDCHSNIAALTPRLSGLSGNLLKYAKIGRDLELDDRLVKRYIETLELMFIFQRIPSYAKNRAKRLVVSLPKIFSTDTGLACALLGIRNGESLLTTNHYGALLENLVYLELRKAAVWAKEPISLLHFRDNRQREVDLVIEKDDGKVTGVEVKASASVSVRDFRGLSALSELTGERFEQGILLYTGHRVLPFRISGRNFLALPLTAVIPANN